VAPEIIPEHVANVGAAMGIVAVGVAGDFDSRSVRPFGSDQLRSGVHCPINVLASQLRDDTALFASGR
jgi:hypothetical protein